MKASKKTWIFLAVAMFLLAALVLMDMQWYGVLGIGSNFYLILIFSFYALVLVSAAMFVRNWIIGLNDGKTKHGQSPNA